MKAFFTFLIFLVYCAIDAQTMVSIIPSHRTNYCLKKDSDSTNLLIGTKVKIWSNGGIYDDINRTDYLEWPSQKVKRMSGKNRWRWTFYYPKTGEIGTIIHVFQSSAPEANVASMIYLLDIKGKYVPIGCGHLTGINNPDEDEEWEIWRRNDSIRRIEYAAGCKFKTRGINNCWNRAGIFNIDVISETFICDLQQKGIDTLIFCKDIFDNGSLPGEKAFVLWIDNGQGYIKSFFNNSQHNPTNDTIKTFEVNQYIDKFNDLHLDTVTTEPGISSWSHSMGYVIQVYTPATFYCGRLVDNLIDEKPTHPKAIFWKMMTDDLNKIKKE